MDRAQKIVWKCGAVSVAHPSIAVIKGEVHARRNDPSVDTTHTSPVCAEFVTTEKARSIDATLGRGPLGSFPLGLRLTTTTTTATKRAKKRTTP